MQLISPFLPFGPGKEFVDRHRRFLSFAHEPNLPSALREAKPRSAGALPAHELVISLYQSS